MISAHISQEQNKNKLFLQADSCLSELSIPQKKVLAFVNYMRRKYPQVFPSHKHIATNIGMSVSTVQRALNHLYKRGLIAWHSREYDTNYYYLHARLLSLENQEVLMKFYRIFLTLFLFLLSPKRCVAADDRPNKNKEFNLTTNLLYVGDSSRGPVILCTNDKKKNNQQEPRLLDSSGSDSSDEAEYDRLRKEEAIKRKAHELQRREEAIATVYQHFPLTDHGLIRLKAYPAASIWYAFKRLATALTKDNPYEYFIGTCNQYCKKNLLIPALDRYRQERKTLKIDPQDKEFIDHDKLREVYSFGPDMDKADLYFQVAQALQFEDIFKEHVATVAARQMATHKPAAYTPFKGIQVLSAQEIDERRAGAIAEFQYSPRTNEFQQILMNGWEKQDEESLRASKEQPTHDEEYYTEQVAAAEEVFQGHAGQPWMKSYYLQIARDAAKDPAVPLHIRREMNRLVDTYGQS